jgi:hypothetical protein
LFIFLVDLVPTTLAAMATHVRQPQPHREEDPPVQLFLPRPGKEEAILALLRLKNPTKQDVLDHLSGRYDKTETHPLTEQEELYYNRRKQIHEWSSQVETGGAKIDEHDRLVLATEPDPLPPMNHVPEPPRNPEAEEEEERRLRQQEEQDAEIAISRAVKRYRKQGVAEEDFQLIRIPPENQDSSVNLTFRRICCAVLAVVTAFICIMLQTLPLLNSVTQSNPIFDKLMVELLNVRHFREHAVHCPQLNRDHSSNWLVGDVPAINCAHGVLHIPSRPVLRDEYWKASEPRQSDALEDYITGVNVSWFIKCHPVPTNEMPSRNPASGVCPTTSSERCFRGIHDGWLSDFDIESVLEMGAALIKGGGDHFDIHENIALLDDNVPLVLEKVKYLLLREYGLHQTIVPVAFRVNIALPMDATDVLGTKTSKLLGKNINKTVRDISFILFTDVQLCLHPLIL